MDPHPIETITLLIRAAQDAATEFAAGRSRDEIDAGVEDAARTSYIAFIDDRETDHREFADWRYAFGIRCLSSLV